MADDDDILAPRLDPEHFVHFTDSHRPEMQDGVYKITLSHAQPALDLDATRSIEVVVQGPRYTLDSSEIAGQFPPKGASGHFETTLPHIALSRATLPWDRTGDSPEQVPGQRPQGAPWIALLVLTEEELAGRVRTVTVGELATLPGYTALDAEPGEDPGQRCRVITLPQPLAQACLPSRAELEMLASVRDVRREGAGSRHWGKANIVQPARAILMAKRLPPAGQRCQAHLVSVEKQYPGAEGPHPALGPGREDVTLVSLATWSFTVEKSRGSLTEALKAVTFKSVALPADRLAQTQAQVVNGAVPVHHLTRDGARKPAWYTGPLRPARDIVLPDLPVLHGPDLTRIDAQTGLADISLAAAWELGRLLMMKDASRAIKLRNWKRRMLHADRAKAQRTQNPGVVTTTLSPPDFPLGTWFRRALNLLEEVPFTYLVPDPKMVPPETLAEFTISHAWRACLMDGAMSVGRHGQRALEEDRKLLKAHAPLPALAEIHGILFRSHVLRDYPDLVIDGLGDTTVVQPIRYERLAPDTLLMLWPVRIQRYEMHLHPQALHFGVDDVDANGRVGKDGHRAAAETGHVDILDLATKLSPGRSGSAAFAMAMLEGVPKVIFRTEAPS